MNCILTRTSATYKAEEKAQFWQLALVLISCLTGKKYLAILFFNYLNCCSIFHCVLFLFVKTLHSEFQMQSLNELSSARTKAC